MATRFDYTYYSLSLNNIDAETSDALAHEPNLVFNEQRDVALITDCEDYDFAIENFKIDLKTLPSFIPTIRTNFNNDLTTLEKDTTIYTIGLSYTDPGDSTTYGGFAKVIFTAQDLTIPQPNFQNGYADYKVGYYNVFNYEYFLVMVNKAIAEATYSLKTSLGSSGLNAEALVLVNNIPFFTFDKDTQLINFQAPSDIYSNNYNVVLNTPLYRLFNSLPALTNKDTYKMVIIAYQSITTVYKEVHGFKLNLSNFGQTSVVTVISPPQLDGSISNTSATYLSIYQDYPTVDSWSPVESIVISSDTIPIKSSARSSNHSFVNGLETTKGSKNVSELEITDFKAGDYEGGVIYNPTEKRWLNMVQQKELSRISINVFYRSKLTGELIPIKINSGGSFSMKLVFRKVKLY
jgi:hypothetical protein